MWSLVFSRVRSARCVRNLIIESLENRCLLAGDKLDTISVPGFMVESFVEIDDPVALAIDQATGNLYVGNDVGGTGNLLPAKVRRVTPDRVVTEIGNVPIDDPDAVAFDATGVVSGVAGSVLVGGLAISAIAPDGTVTQLFEAGNVTAMATDSTGRLLFTELGSNDVRTSTGGTATTLYSQPGRGRGITIDAADNIYTAIADGTVLLHDPGGNTLNDSFGSPATWLAIGQGGGFGTDLYGLHEGELVRFDNQGNRTVIGTGFAEQNTFPAFGPDGTLYISELQRDRIVRITAPSQPDINVISVKLVNAKTVEYVYQATGDIDEFDVVLYRSSDRELSNDDEVLASTRVDVTGIEAIERIDFIEDHIPKKPYLLVAVDSEHDTDESNDVKAHLPTLTIVTHGLRPSGAFPHWVTDMGRAINKRLGHQCTDEEIEKSQIVRQVVEERRDAGDDNAFDPPADGCDQLLLFDWADLSNNAGTADNDEVAGILRQLVENRIADGTKPFVHFIGHSRGAFVIRSAIEQLDELVEEATIEFLHMTVLDHRPFNIPFSDDGQMYIPSIVDYADNYYQNVGKTGVFEGKPIDDAVNVNILDALTAFNSDDPGLNEHSEVRAWYHWTIDTAVDAADASPNREYKHVPYPNPNRATIFAELAWQKGENIGYSWVVGSERFASRPIFLKGSPVEGTFVAITTDDAASASVESVPVPGQAPKHVEYRLGTFHVDVRGIPDGGTAILTIYYPHREDINSFYNYSSTPTNAEPHWYSFEYDQTTKTGTIIKDGVVTAFYVDGQRGDADHIANGVITITSGPAVRRPWHNDSNPFDVDGDGLINNEDASKVIGALGNTNGGGRIEMLGEDRFIPPIFPDINGDNILSHIDALLLVSLLRVSNSITPAAARASDSSDFTVVPCGGESRYRVQPILAPTSPRQAPLVTDLDGGIIGEERSLKRRYGRSGQRFR